MRDLLASLFVLSRRLAVVSLALGLLSAHNLAASSYGEQAVRAVYLLNFIRFTEWPAAALPEGASYVVGVAGNRSLEEELLSLADQQRVRDRKVRVVRVNNARDVAGCHLLYIEAAPRPGEESAPGADELLPAVRGSPVLTVSDSPRFLNQGGIINLYVADEAKLRFAIAPSRARAAGLTLSSRLLALARIIDPEDASSSP